MNDLEILQTYKDWLGGLNTKIEEALRLQKMTHRALYEKAGLNRSAWYRRVEDSLLWKKDEIKTVCDLTGIALTSYTEFQGVLSRLESGVSGFKKEKLAEMLGMSYESLYRRFKEPDNFSFEEIERLLNLTNLMK